MRWSRRRPGTHPVHMPRKPRRPTYASARCCRHQVRVAPQREARVRVAQVLAHGPDRFARIQQHRGVVTPRGGSPRHPAIDRGSGPAASPSPAPSSATTAYRLRRPSETRIGVLREQGRGEGEYDPGSTAGCRDFCVARAPFTDWSGSCNRPVMSNQALQCATAPRVGEPDEMRAAQPGLRKSSQRLRQLQHDDGELGPLRA